MPLLVVFFFLLLLSFPLPILSSQRQPQTETPTPSAYEVLESYDLPVGLLPVGALGYDLDPSTGKFAARLPGTCGFSLEGSYQLRYSPVISGYISPGRIRSLRGVSVKVLLFWLDIVDIARDGQDLRFSVGVASAGFAVDNFSVCPRCGCGLVCHDQDKPPLLLLDDDHGSYIHRIGSDRIYLPRSFQRV